LSEGTAVNLKELGVSHDNKVLNQNALATTCLNPETERERERERELYVNGEKQHLNFTAS
jgi:hypothetical protein